MAKIAITGRDAVQLATLAFTRDVAKAKPGQSIYMLLLNEGAGIENDGVATIVQSKSGGILIKIIIIFLYSKFMRQKNVKNY